MTASFPHLITTLTAAEPFKTVPLPPPGPLALPFPAQKILSHQFTMALAGITGYFCPLYMEPLSLNHRFCSQLLHLHSHSKANRRHWCFLTTYHAPGTTVSPSEITNQPQPCRWWLGAHSHGPVTRGPGGWGSLCRRRFKGQVRQRRQRRNHMCLEHWAVKKQAMCEALQFFFLIFIGI